jgi:hypothetical protein
LAAKVQYIAGSAHRSPFGAISWPGLSFALPLNSLLDKCLDGHRLSRGFAGLCADGANLASAGEQAFLGKSDVRPKRIVPGIPIISKNDDFTATS